MSKSEKKDNIIYSVCQQCNTNCGIGVRVRQGRVVAVEGNPYSPWTCTPHIPYATPFKEAQMQQGALCPKGYAGIQTLYDPYRIKKVLKRVGKRGENRWQSVDFHEAIREIVEGGDLFGEGHVQGLRDLSPMRDPKISTAMQKDAKAVAQKKLSLTEFQNKYAVHLHTLIDPKHPDLGPKNNQICYSWGRQKDGRAQLAKRFFAQGLGTINTHGHTTVCQGSLYFACKAMSDQFCEGSFNGGKKFFWQADTAHASFILFVGSNPLEANTGPPLRAGKMARNVAEGCQRIAVVDPRFSKTAALAWKWIAINPQGVGALAMAIIRWMFDNNRYDTRYLSHCNKAAAFQGNEPTWSQGAWLVKLDVHGAPSSFLRASDLGHAVEVRKKADGTSWEFDAFVALHPHNDGHAVFFDPNDTETAACGQLFVHSRMGGHSVKSVLQLYKEAAEERSLEQWAELAGTTGAEVAELAHEFTSHGKKAVVDMHRGVSQHTAGFYNVSLWMLINILMGNVDHKGGLVKGTSYATQGADGSFDLHSAPKGTALEPWGISLIRHGVHYEETTLFTGYPAKRPWYPFASDIYQEIIPSAGDAYPYGIKALFLYMAAPVYSLPAGHELIQILRDPQKIPLVVASDITVGETSLYADYIFPDVTYLERWEFPGSQPSLACKAGPVRQPTVAPLTGTVRVFGQEVPQNFEALLLALAEYLHLPGFGPQGFGENAPLQNQEDFYLRMVANMTIDDKLVPAALEEELSSFIHNRCHLPSAVFHAERWKNVVGAELWPRVVTILSRGGRFEAFEDGYDGELLAHRYGKMVGIYFEKLALSRHSMTGNPLLPYGRVLPSPLDCLGNTIEDASKGYTLTLITYKTISQTKTRTAGNTWLRVLAPENFVEISAHDAAQLGLENGYVVRILSASNTQGLWRINDTLTIPMQGKIKILQGLRPGVVAFALGYGHWANGAAHMIIDGARIQGDPSRASGFHANAAMCVDPVLKNTGLADTVGGSAVFFESKVKLVKVEEM